MRAIVPSSFMISQITPAARPPARRARSTMPSVWPGALQHAAVERAQRKDVSGPDQVVGLRTRRDRGADGVRAVGGADAGGHTLRGFDRDGEARPVLARVALDLHLQAQAIAHLARHRQADQTAASRAMKLIASG
jgi:hypothetical protein